MTPTRLQLSDAYAPDRTNHLRHGCSECYGVLLLFLITLILGQAVDIISPWPLQTTLPVQLIVIARFWRENGNKNFLRCSYVPDCKRLIKNAIRCQRQYLLC
jgi:hypothetical protein